MHVIYDDATLAAYRASAPDPVMAGHVERLVAQARRQGLWDRTCVSVLAADEPLDELAVLLGDGPLAIPWTWTTDYGPVIELGVTAGNDGFAHIVLAGRSGVLGN